MNKLSLLKGTVAPLFSVGLGSLIVASACGGDDRVYADGEAGGAAGLAQAGGTSAGTSNSFGGNSSGGTSSAGTGGSSNQSGGSGTGGSNTGGAGGTTIEPGGCGNGSYDHDDDPSTGCVLWTNCKAGEFISKPGTSKTDRECKACDEGFFSTTVNAATCEKWTDCEPGEFQTQAGDVDANRQCEACAADHYSTENNQASCERWTDCEEGFFIETNGSEQLDRTCAPCAPGSFAPDENSTECHPWTAQCNDGWVQAAGGSATADITCVDGWYKTIRNLALPPSSNPISVPRQRAAGLAISAAGNILLTSSAIQQVGSAPEAYRHTSGFGLYDAMGTALQTSTDVGGSHEAFGMSRIPGATASYFYIGGRQGNPTVTTGINFGAIQKVTINSGSFSVGSILRPPGYSGTSAHFSATYAIDLNPITMWHFFASGVRRASPDTGIDAVIHALDSTGTERWSWWGVGGSGTSAEEATAIRYSTIENAVYVAGSAGAALPEESAFGATDGFVAKLDAGSGTKIWVKQFGTNTGDPARAIATDPTGNVVVAGVTSGELPGPANGQQDIYIRKYNATGALSWAHQFGTDKSDDVAAIEVDSVGNIYVLGTVGNTPITDMVGDTPLPGATDAIIRVYSPAGAVLWTQRIGSPTSQNERGEALTLSQAGGRVVLHVVGHHNQNTHFLTRILAPEFP